MQYVIVDGEGIIPSGTTEIEYDAFTGRKELTSIFIPDSVTQIDVYAFDDCVNLMSIKVSPDNKVYDSREDCNAIIETATNTLILGCATSKIPEDVTTIGWGAFDGCKKLKNIVIPASVRVIDGYAFRYNELEQLELPPSVEVIGESAFERSKKLKSLVIPASVKVIGDMAFFESAKIECVEILSADAKIGGSAFESLPALKTIMMPYVVEYHSIFEDCPKLTNVEMPLVEVIGDGAFMGQTKLKNLMFPMLLEVGEEAFKGCTGLKSIIMPRVEEIKYCAFEDCTQLKNVEMLDVQALGEYAYAGCTALESVEMPSIGVISREAFSGCTALKSVKVSSSNIMGPACSTCAFDGCNNVVSVEFFDVERGDEYYDYEYGISWMSEFDNLKEIIVPAGMGKYIRKEAREVFVDKLIVERKPEGKNQKKKVLKKKRDRGQAPVTRE